MQRPLLLGNENAGDQWGKQNLPLANIHFFLLQSGPRPQPARELVQVLRADRGP